MERSPRDYCSLTSFFGGSPYSVEWIPSPQVGGEICIAFSQASSARVTSTNDDGAARDARMFDLTLYSQWVQATATKEQKYAAYIQEQLIEDFAVASDVGRADKMKEN